MELCVRNTAKHDTNTANRTRMTGDELRSIRLAMGYMPRDMCRELGIPRRTYQDYEAGKRGISDEVAAKVKAAAQREKEVMARIAAKIEALISRNHPHGIMSDIQED